MNRRIKTCLVTHAYPPQVGGVGVSAHRIARGLSEAGLEVHVVHFVASDRAMLLDENTETSRQGLVTLHRVQVCERRRTDGRRLASDEIFRDGHNRQEMFLSLQALVREHRFDVLNALFLANTGPVTVAVGRMEGVKTIACIRGNDVGKEMFSDQGLPMLAYTLRNADYVTSTAHDLLEAADTVTPVAHKARVILNSLDLEPHAGATGLEGRLKGAVVGTVGVIKYKKGLPYLIRALRELARQREISLLVVGDFASAREGELHRELLREAGIEDRTTVTGLVPRERVPAHLSLMDVCVHPSLFSEGCPSALLEAMLARRPVVAARAGAIPEIIVDGANGLLVPPGSSAALALAIARLLDDRTLADRLAAAARETALGLTRDREIARWVEVHEAVLSGRPPEGSKSWLTS